jgi:lipoic acid synthetase
MTLTLPVIQPDALRDLQARKPAWLKVRAPGGPTYMRLKALMRERNLHTVCEEARCPNIGECWEERTATFMILGDVCTRRCGFCAVSHGRPEWEDWEEPDRVGRTVAEMGLAHVVVTSVNRDDLADGGAAIFARTIAAIRREAPGCRVEVLIPDFQGSETALETVLHARPDVLNHNIETVPRLYRHVRPGSRYDRSLGLFRRARGHSTEPVTKSGMMLGLGEAVDEVRATMADLHAAGVQLLTLGQYLRPSPAHLPVERYVPPEEFEALAAEGRALGFRHVEAGPLVRSSYHAKRQVEAAAAGGPGPEAPAGGCGAPERSSGAAAAATGEA